MSYCIKRLDRYGTVLGVTMANRKGQPFGTDIEAKAYARRIAKGTLDWVGLHTYMGADGYFYRIEWSDTDGKTNQHI